MYNVYKLEVGDTLGDIAKKYDCSINHLKELNNLRNDDLRDVSELIVPDSSINYFEYYTIQKGDNLYAISKKYNINPALLASLNGLNSNDYIYPGQVLLIPKSNYSYYITKSGDTLDSVVDIFDISKDKLLNDNNVIYLLEGQLLVKKTK